MKVTNKDYTVPELAEKLGVNPNTVRMWIHNNKLRATYTGSRKHGYRIPGAEAKRLFDQHWVEDEKAEQAGMVTETPMLNRQPGLLEEITALQLRCRELGNSAELDTFGVLNLLEQSIELQGKIIAQLKSL